MKEWLRIFVVVVSLGAASRVVADPGPLELWSPTPAVSWNQEAYSIGNGKLAAMIFGIVGTEQVQFNEATVWCGQPNAYSNPNATPAHLASIRANCFARNDIYPEAQTYLMSYPLRQAHYQPTGVLNLNFAPHSGTSNYRRTLDLNTGTVIV
ncbi:MAG: glycoside hydrolase N-terminal domain-containing protein, partial [Verrucomicrobiota bacterium]